MTQPEVNMRVSKTKFFSAVLFWLLLVQTASASAAKNLLFVVVTSNVMAHRWAGVISAIETQLKDPGYEKLNAGLIMVRNCGKGAAVYSVPIGPANSAKITKELKDTRLEGTHEDLVEAMQIAKGVVKDYIKDHQEAVEVILYAETHCACTADTRHLEILKEIKEISDKANFEFKLDVITTATDKELTAFFDEIATVTGGHAHNVDGIDQESVVLKKVLDRKVVTRVGGPLGAKSAKPAQEAPKKEIPKGEPAKKEQPLPAKKETEKTEKK